MQRHELGDLAEFSEECSYLRSLKFSAMHHLPIEVFHLIFRHLNLNELLVCRIVCVGWRFAVQGFLFRIRSLAICRKIEVPNKGVYFLTNAPINGSMLAHVRNLNFAKIEMFRNILAHLRSLYVDFNYKGFHNFYLYINECVELEQLQIDNFASSRLDINLRSLRIVSVHDLPGSNHGYYLVLNTPNLFAFKCSGQLSFIHFTYPLTITHLCLYERLSDEIRKFENLRYLYTTFNDSFIISFVNPTFNILAKYTKLEEFHFLSLGANFLEGLFLQNKMRSKDGRPVKIYHAGFLVQSLEDYYRNSSSYPFRCNKAFETRLYSNYSNVSNFLPWMREINFGLMFRFLKEIPPDFFLKFINIKKVIITETVYRVDQLVYFLSNCLVLKELYTAGSMLPQTFFQQLPANCPYLSILDIIEPYPIDSLRFILKLNYLNQVRIEQEASVSVVLHAMRKESIKRFTFQFRNELLTVKKRTELDTSYFFAYTKQLWHSDRFEILSPTNNVVFETLDEQMDFLKTIMLNSQWN